MTDSLQVYIPVNRCSVVTAGWAEAVVTPGHIPHQILAGGEGVRTEMGDTTTSTVGVEVVGLGMEVGSNTHTTTVGGIIAEGTIITFR